MHIVVRKLLSVFDVQGKRRTMTLLRSLPEHQLRDVGISPELLSMGVRAWPWQLPENAQRNIPGPPLANLSELRTGKVDSTDIQVAEQSAA